MKLRWRSNPKTEDGWFKWTAVSLLVALGGFLAALPITFAISLNHLQHAYPGDPENFLGAITTGVLVGVAFAGLCFAGTMALQFLLSVLRRRASPQPEV